MYVNKLGAGGRVPYLHELEQGFVKITILHDRTSTMNNTVHYCCGMVMRHVRYNYHCVIRGWDNKCKMPNEWILVMGVDRLPNGPDQPFYHVLVHEDGSER